MSRPASPSVEDRWRGAGLVPLLLRAPPPYPLRLTFNRRTGKRGRKLSNSAVELGQELATNDITRMPALDWTTDAKEPEALWTVACVDVDWPNPELLAETAEQPIYRSTAVAGASTPTQQRIVSLHVNVPAPHLIDKGHCMAEWDPDEEELEKKEALHRFVVFVFKQSGAVPVKQLGEEGCMSGENHRIASLPKFLHKHAAIQPESWAASFFIVDTQPDEAHARALKTAKMEAPLESMVTLPPSVKHPGQHFPKAEHPAHLSARTMGEEHGPRGAVPPPEERRSATRAKDAPLDMTLPSELEKDEQKRAGEPKTS